MINRTLMRAMPAMLAMLAMPDVPAQRASRAARRTPRTKRLAISLPLLLAALHVADVRAQAQPQPEATPSSAVAPDTGTPDAEASRLAAMPVAAQAQWLTQAIKSGELAKMRDEAIVARLQALQADALVRVLKAESAALPEYQYELTRHERINDQWQTTPDRMFVKIREKPLQIYAKWLPGGAHAGQEIIYDETKNPKEMYGHLGGILGFTSIWSSIDGPLARSQSNHTVRDLGFAFIAERIAHDGRSFRAEGLSDKPARISASELNGVRVAALEWEAPSGPPQHYARKSRVLIDLKTGLPRGIEAWDASGQKIEEMRFEKVRKMQWTDATFDPRNPDYKF
ncbi:DUF1571 domain-containing protein [Pandoraea pnomenusa]|uniref:DUF1571 domain-containing protein n=1 Tax=Pandoraea pnomenusa TaxID=93220 RepID=UPI001CB9AA5F|nr:DUF1571 domain-containing protein [Pandoraea pnomenusa]